MAGTVTFELVSPERLLMSVEAEHVVVPSSEGEFGVLAEHAPAMATLRPGLVRVYESAGAAPTAMFVGGGFVEVAENRVTILADQALALTDADAAAANRELANAREDLAEATTERARLDLEAKIARLETLLTLLGS